MSAHHISCHQVCSKAGRRLTAVNSHMCLLLCCVTHWGENDSSCRHYTQTHTLKFKTPRQQSLDTFHKTKWSQISEDVRPYVPSPEPVFCVYLLVCMCAHSFILITLQRRSNRSHMCVWLRLDSLTSKYGRNAKYATEGKNERRRGSERGRPRFVIVQNVDSRS